MRQPLSVIFPVVAGRHGSISPKYILKISLGGESQVCADFQSILGYKPPARTIPPLLPPSNGGCGPKRPSDPRVPESPQLPSAPAAASPGRNPAVPCMGVLWQRGSPTDTAAPLPSRFCHTSHSPKECFTAFWCRMSLGYITRIRQCLS